jgi:hypothetical protein
MPADSTNAYAIRNLMEDAANKLVEAECALRDAVQLAADDFDHNGDKAQDALGAVRLARSAVAGEWHIWDGYAWARKRQEKNAG